MAEFTALPQLPAFVPDADPSSVAQRWKRWVDRFENLIVALNVTNNARKKALLLHLAGEAVYEIFDGLVVAEVAADADPALDNVYVNAKRALDEHFSPKQNAEFEIYTFRKAEQRQDETTDAYHARLRSLAKYCGFANVDAEIKSHIIQTCTSSRLRRRALTQPDMTLQQLVETARSMEAAERQVKCIENGAADTTTVAAVNNNTGNFRRQNTSNLRGTSSQSCRFCGGSYPHPGGRTSCPSWGKACRTCGVLNHYSKVCLSAANHNQQQRPTYNRAPEPRNISSHATPAPQWNRQQRVRQIVDDNTELQDDEQGDDSDVDVGLYALHVGSESRPPAPLKQPQTRITVNKTQMKFTIDTGASVNIIDDAAYALLTPRPRLQHTRTKIYAYGSTTPMPVRGSFRATMESKNKITDAIIYVVRGECGSLLSYTTASELGVVKVSINSVSSSQKLITIDQLAATHPQLFTGIGKLKNHEVELHIDPTVKPVAQPHRRVPFHLRKQVEDELQLLLDQDIIERAEGPTPWLSPIVTPIKPHSSPPKVRVCLDMRVANTAIMRERHVMPTLEDIIHDLNGSTVFSKLDLNSAYHQLLLTPASRSITTFSTHVGLFRYKRLFFGVSSASEKFQETIRQLLSGIPGVMNISDDILVHAATQEEHNVRLRAVIQRLLDNGLTLNKIKCRLNQKRVDFYGHTFSSEGVAVQPKHIEAITKLQPPNNVAGVRSFLSTANYSARFINNYATITEPLRNLTKADVPWHFGERELKAFQDIKQGLANSTFTSYFDPNRHTSLIVDASPVGLSAMLVQTGSDNIRRVISYASRSLSSVEQRYSQTEREALACVFGCERYHMYLYGAKEFDLISDHRSLKWIFGNPNAKLPVRIERWGLRLMPYKFKVVYTRGESNPSDYTSRHPVNTTAEGDEEPATRIAEEHINFVIAAAAPRAINIEQIKQATREDHVLQHILQLLQSGSWQEAAADPMLRPYYNVRDELCSNKDGDIILRDKRIVLPQSLQLQAINIAHQGHQGIVRTKRMLRDKLWFPGIDRLTESAIKSCIACQATTPEYHNEPLKMSALPTEEWTELSADFLGPLPSGDYLLVIIDEYSRFPVVEILQSTSAAAVIPVLDRVFSLMGNCQVLKTDNGAPWNSEGLAKFARYLGFTHKRITPYWPLANSEPERFMKTVSKVLRTARIEGKFWKQELFTFLRAYRNTPHCTTNKTPAELLFHRQIRTQLPQHDATGAQPAADTELRQTDTAAKQRMKEYADNRRHAHPITIRVGDQVLVKTPRLNKLTSYYDPRPYRVTHVRGSMITASRENHSISRNSSFFKLLTHPPTSSRIDNSEDEDDYSDPVAARPEAANQQQPAMQQPAVNQPAINNQRRYPQRQARRQPARLTDFVVQ